MRSLGGCAVSDLDDAPGRPPRTETYAEHAPLVPAFAADVDRAAVQADELLRQAEPDAQAAARPIERLRRLIEELEDPSELVGRQADAGVAHRQAHVAVRPARLDFTDPVVV